MYIHIYIYVLWDCQDGRLRHCVEERLSWRGRTRGLSLQGFAVSDQKVPNIAALASTRLIARRLTSTATPRFHAISIPNPVFDRHASRPAQRNFHSTPTLNKAILSALADLLTEHQSQKQPDAAEATQTKHPPIPKGPQRVTAEFEPFFRPKYRRDSPAFNWRRRLQIGGSKKPRDDAAADVHTVNNALGEVVFSEKHKARLAPHYPPFFEEYINPTYCSIRKMRSYVQILTTPTADTPGTTLLLHFDNKNYLIGSLAEGTQRACVQMGARLLKVSECFLTGRSEWTNTGGLIGMILTLADSSASSQASSWEDALKKKAKKLGIMDGTPEMTQLEEQTKREASNSLTMFGPPNLNHTLATARRYVFRKGMPVDIHEIRDDETPTQQEDEWAPFWADENIKVWAMSISPRISDGANATTPKSCSPRKRSLDEAFGERHGTLTVSEDLTQKERDYLTVKAVVSEMFNSSWRLDTLYETSLADVKQPATVFIRNAQTNKIDKYRGPMPGGKEPVLDPDLKVLVRRPWPGALVESLPQTQPAKEAVSYIIRNHIQRGKFLPERAEQLKVPKGRAWAQLASGASVQNSDGETITPEQVLEPSRVGGGIAVIDIPGPEYIDALISRPEWREPKVMEGVGAVTWICGKDVATDSRLHAFIKEFSHLEHVVSSPDYCPNNIALDSAAAATVRLKEVDPARYNVPVHDAEDAAPQAYGGSAAYQEVRTSNPLPARIAARGQVVQLEPSIEVLTRETIPALKISETAAEVPKDVMEEALKAQEASKTIDSDMQRWLDSLPSGAKDVQVTTLGTGSALPSKYRNVSSTLVRVPGWGNILLDAGENTLGQLKRVFGTELKQILQDLKIIWISHMHADHQLGTTSVIKEWYQQVHGSRPASLTEKQADYTARLQQKRLAIISEPAMLQWLLEYSALEDYGHSRLAPLFVPKDGRDLGKLSWFIPPGELKDLSWEDSQKRLEEAVLPASALGLAEIQAVMVRHCHGARAVSITTPSGFKVSYSGDCRPSNDFARIGRGSTVCIHEATFDDELQGDAEAKNHSTTSEALEIAQRMRAKACVLTHFSQRYQKVPVLERGDADIPLEGEMDLTIDESASPDDSMDAPLADVAEQTLPFQPATEGDSGQQYDLPPRGGSAAGKAIKFKLNSDMKVCVAFDYMNVKVGDIGHMEKFTPALLKLFAEEENSQQAEVAGRNVVNVTGDGGSGRKEKKKGRSVRNN